VQTALGTRRLEIHQTYTVLGASSTVVGCLVMDWMQMTPVNRHPGTTTSRIRAFKQVRAYLHAHIDERSVAWSKKETRGKNPLPTVTVLDLT
jgi:hypothetical protein